MVLITIFLLLHTEELLFQPNQSHPCSPKTVLSLCWEYPPRSFLPIQSLLILQGPARLACSSKNLQNNLGQIDLLLKTVLPILGPFKKFSLSKNKKLQHTSVKIFTVISLNFRLLYLFWIFFFSFCLTWFHPAWHV